MRLEASILKETVWKWFEDGVPGLGAALAYYALFSLAPLMVILIAVAGLAFDKVAVEQQLLNQIELTVGPDSAALVAGLVRSIRLAGGGLIASILGLSTLLLGATLFFAALQTSLNSVWKAQAPPGGVLFWLVIKRALSLAMVLATGFLLLVSLVASAALEVVVRYLPGWVHSYLLIRTAEIVISLVITTFLFAAIYKVLPDVDIAWSDVWVGALATSLLFNLGKFGIGLYLGSAGVASTYGAAGAVVLILVWVYYSAQVVLLGAEFTQVYACRYGSGFTSRNRWKRS